MHLPRGKYEKIHGFKLQVGWSNFSLHLPTFQSSNVTARRLQSTCQGTQHISIHIRYKCPVEDVRWIHNGGSQSQNISFFKDDFAPKITFPHRFLDDVGPRYSPKFCPTTPTGGSRPILLSWQFRWHLAWHQMSNVPFFNSKKQLER